MLKSCIAARHRPRSRPSWSIVVSYAVSLRMYVERSRYINRFKCKNPRDSVGRHRPRFDTPVAQVAAKSLRESWLPSPPYSPSKLLLKLLVPRFLEEEL